MLTAVRKRWFSWDYTISEGSRDLADITMARWRESGVVTVQGVAFRASREGRMSGDFRLQGPGATVARASKPSAFRRAFVVAHEGDHYILRSRSLVSRAFVLLKGEREVGSVTPTSIFSRSAVIDLPADLPLPVRAFIVWLVIISWKRAARAAAAGG